jgi:hypothetical protein
MSTPEATGMTPEQLDELKVQVTAAVEARGGVRRGESRWLSFPCPNGGAHAHGDRTPSAGWEPGEGVWKCLGCKLRGGAVDLARRLGVPLPERREQGAQHPTVYLLRDRAGDVVAEHHRIDFSPGRWCATHKKTCTKHMWWRLPNATRNGLDGRQPRDLPLYGVHELPSTEGATVVLVEGQKARDTLAARGIVAVGTVTGAATIPNDDVLCALVGSDVVCWPDADEPGRQHMRGIGERLTALGITHHTIEPWRDATDGRDAANWRGSDDELRALITSPTSTPSPLPRISRRLSTILADPAALEPPALVIPRLAWRGRTTLLAAREKAGKSTLATAAAAAVSQGVLWLGDATTPGTVLWVALEEHVSDLAARFHDWQADAARIHVIDSLWGLDEPMDALHAEACAVMPTLLVVDTLSALVDATGARPDPGSSTAWTPIMSALTRIARDTDAAVVHLHHARKSDGAYRDSSAIGAGVDAIVEMADGPDADVRVLRVRARWQVGDYSIRLAGEPGAKRYELATGEPSLDARVLQYVEAHPGCSARAVRAGVAGRTEDIGAAIRRLRGVHAIENRGDETAMSLYTPGTTSGTTLVPAVPAQGTKAGTTSGTTPVPVSKPLVSETGTTPETWGDV